MLVHNTDLDQFLTPLRELQFEQLCTPFHALPGMQNGRTQGLGLMNNAEFARSNRVKAIRSNSTCQSQRINSGAEANSWKVLAVSLAAAE